MAIEMSRRNFLKGTAATAVSLVAMNVLDKAVAKAESKMASWKIAPAAIPAEQISNTVDADVVVIGAGHAGVTCARAAAEGGATVILVEEQKEESYFIWGSEYGGINSEFMKNKWGYEPVDKAECYHDWMLRNSFRANPAFVKSYVDKSGTTFDWMMEVQDAEFIEGFSTNGLPGPKHFSGEQHGQKTWPSSIEMYNSGTLHKKNIAKMLSCNSANRMLWGTSGEQLVREGDRVVAAIVKDAEGKYIRLNAKKGVVIATGGFAGNAEMCHDIYHNIVGKFPKEMQETANVSYPLVPRMGKGHQMCVWAGAAWEPDEPASMSWQNPCGMNPFNNAKFALCNLWLNGQGKRYVSEGGDFELSGLMGQYQEMNEDGTITVMSIFDSSLLEDLQYQQAGHATSCLNDGVVGASIVEGMKKNMQATIDAGDEGWMSGFVGALVYAGNTLEQLANRMGLEGEVRDNFFASVDRYNQMCDKKHDDDFFKDPALLHPIKEAPYFGYKVDYAISVGLTTLSGMWTDDNQCCLDDKTHKQIEGLYATGNVCGRRWIGAYSTSVAGQSVALACTLGKELGEHLAAKA